MNILFSLDRQVSWVRRKHGEDDLQLLTVGLHTYSGDSRYTVEFQYPNNWRLQIKFTNKRDEGTYECQISTHPPKVIQLHLHINGEQLSVAAIRQYVLWLLSIVYSSLIQYVPHQWSYGNYNKCMRLSKKTRRNERKFTPSQSTSLQLWCLFMLQYCLMCYNLRD